MEKEKEWKRPMTLREIADAEYETPYPDNLSQDTWKEINKIIADGIFKWLLLFISIGIAIGVFVTILFQQIF